MSDCLFCKIANHDIPADIFYEDDKSMAVLDIHPHAPGHIFIIPKAHASNLINLPDNLVSPLFLTVKKIASILKEKLSADGLTIGINQGRASGQEVDHLHIHILPRFSDDGGSSVQGIINNPPVNQVEIKQLLGLVD